MKKLVICTLSIGKLYEIYTRYLFKQLDFLDIKDISYSVTADTDFSRQLVSQNIKVDFHVLDKTVIENSRASKGLKKTTVFKYYLKSLAIKNTVKIYPGHPILHIDCDSIPDKDFGLSFLKDKDAAGIWCGEFVNCSGNYGSPVGEIEIHKKIFPIFTK